MTTTLYAIPFACSLAPHIALEELGEPFEVVWFDLAGRTDQENRPLADTNPKNKVAVLEDGERLLTENAAILYYLAERGGWQGDRVGLVEALSFVATELHKQVLSLHFDPAAPQAAKDFGRAVRLPPMLAFVDERLAARQHLLGAEVCVADHYLFWALWLMRQAQIALPEGLSAFLERHAARPAVARVLEREYEAFQRQGDLVHK